MDCHMQCSAHRAFSQHNPQSLALWLQWSPTTCGADSMQSSFEDISSCSLWFRGTLWSPCTPELPAQLRTLPWHLEHFLSLLLPLFNYFITKALPPSLMDSDRPAVGLSWSQLALALPELREASGISSQKPPLELSSTRVSPHNLDTLLSCSSQHLWHHTSALKVKMWWKARQEKTRLILEWIREE